MKKFKIISMILSIALIFLACGTETISGNDKEELSSDQVIENVSVSFDEIGSLSQDVELVILNDFNSVVDTSSQTLGSSIIYIDNGNISHIYTVNELIAQNQRSTQEFYKTPEGIYMYDGVSWQEYSGPESYNTTYEPVLDSFLSISSEFEMTENSDNYTFSFTGQDGNIFRTVGKPYSLVFNSYPDDEVELDVEFIIEKETFFITDVNIHALGDYGDGNLAEITTTVDFSNFNEIDSDNFPIPDTLDTNSNTL